MEATITAAELLEALRGLEWAGTSNDEESMCLFCWHHKDGIPAYTDWNNNKVAEQLPNTHAADCEWVRLTR